MQSHPIHLNIILRLIKHVCNMLQFLIIKYNLLFNPESCLKEDDCNLGMIENLGLPELELSITLWWLLPLTCSSCSFPFIYILEETKA